MRTFQLRARYGTFNTWTAGAHLSNACGNVCVPRASPSITFWLRELPGNMPDLKISRRCSWISPYLPFTCLSVCLCFGFVMPLSVLVWLSYKISLVSLTFISATDHLSFSFYLLSLFFFLLISSLNLVFLYNLWSVRNLSFL